VQQETEVKLRWIYSGELTESNLAESFKGIDGMLIAPGFGDRGIEGKILAKFARENRIPLLGICLGMQIMTIEFARNVLGYRDANSSEFDLTTKYPVISIMEEQKCSRKRRYHEVRRLEMSIKT
jgi:CTP synthase